MSIAQVILFYHGVRDLPAIGVITAATIRYELNIYAAFPEALEI
jgi:hypothetical protein